MTTPHDQTITINTTVDTQTVAAATPWQPLPPFPESVLRPRRLRWRRRLRALGLLVVVAAVAAGGALVAGQVTAEETTTLRTATASTQTVSERYQAVAAIEPVTRAEVAFPIAGTVTAVDVNVGDTVEIGDTLASVDTAELEQALRQAESALASAQLTLNVALSGEDPSSTGAGGLGGSAPAVGVSTNDDVVFAFATASVDAYRYALVSAADEVAPAQQAVVAAQSAVTTASNTAAAKRDAAMSICAAVNVTIDPNDPEGSLGTISTSLGACQSALNELMAAQDALTGAQNQLTTAADTLDNLLDAWAAELDTGASTTTTPAPTTTTPAPTTTTPETSQASTTTTTTTPPSEPTPPTTTPEDGAQAPEGSPSGGDLPSGGGSFSGGAPSGAAPSGGGSPTAETREPTAAELIAYQTAYAAAAQSVEAAQQAIDQATMVAPISGTVVAVDLAAGDSIDAASETQTIVVQGDGGYEATLSVSVDDIDRIAVGQTAELAPDGGGATVSGQVVAISEVPDSTGTTANYRVTVGLSGDTAQLRDGNIGDVAIVIDSGNDTTAVPTSAVTPTGTGYTVDVVGVDGETSTVAVEVGAIGTEWTEIRSGIEIGQTVVIADLDEPLPGSATDTSNETGGGGEFPGSEGGFPGGGFPRQFGG